MYRVKQQSEGMLLLSPNQCYHVNSFFFFFEQSSPQCLVCVCEYSSVCTRVFEDTRICCMWGDCPCGYDDTSYTHTNTESRPCVGEEPQAVQVSNAWQPGSAGARPRLSRGPAMLGAPQPHRHRLCPTVGRRGWAVCLWSRFACWEGAPRAVETGPCAASLPGLCPPPSRPRAHRAWADFHVLSLILTCWLCLRVTLVAASQCGRMHEFLSIF